MKTYRLLFMAAVLCATACDKTQETAVVPEQNASEHGILYASLETSTKTTLSVGASSASVSWSENDNITVFNGIDPSDPSIHTQNARYRLQTIEAGVGQFAFLTQHDTVAEAPEEVDETISPLVAVYCYRGIGTNVYDPVNKVITHRLPTTQTYVPGSFDPYAYTMVAVSDDNKLQFKGAVGVLELNLTGTEVIKSIVVEGDKNIVWNGTIDVSSDEKIAEPVLVMYHDDGASNEKKITYSCGEGVQLSASPTPFYIVLPVGVHNLTLTINAAHSSMVKLAPNLEIKRAVITPTAALDYAATETPIDLSGDGIKIANCYVVSAAGNYMFDAKTPGGTSFTGDGYTADWLWVTCGGWTSESDATGADRLIRDIEYFDGKIYFSTNSSFSGKNVGNAIVGIFKDGDLKWSWHIWETLEPKDETVGAYTFMDRNIGAMNKFDAAGNGYFNNASRGFYFQWGRKDPIIWPRGTSAKKGAYSASNAFAVVGNYATHYLTNTDAWANATSWNAMTTAPEGWTYSAENAAKYPTSMLSSDMMPSFAAGTTWSEEADPCPYGYHVMSEAEAQSLIDLGLSKWAQVSTKNGIQNGSAVCNDMLVFPFVGYRKEDGTVSFNWSSGAADGDNSSRLNGKYYVSGSAAANKGRNLDINNAATSLKFQNVGPNLGMSVRCVKD